MAGMCSSRLVEPPNAAWTAMALRSGGVGQDVPRRRSALLQLQHGARGAAGHIEPDRLAGRRQRRVRQRQAQRFADDLRRGGGAEELAAAAGRRAGPAAQVGRLLQA